MSTPSASLQLASPYTTALALADVGAYHWGIPRDGLEVLTPSISSPRIRFTQDGSLTPGDWYLDTFENWIEFLIGFGLSGEVAQAFLAGLTKGKRAGLALTALGFYPLKLRVPKGETMTYSPHGKIVLQGSFGADGAAVAEQWSASMSYDVIGEDVGAMPATLQTATLTAIASAWSNVFIPAAGQAPFPSNVTVDTICYYRAQADGTTTGGTWQRHPVPSIARRATGTVFLPFQVATVVTLDAGGARGGRYGRFYLPPIGRNVLSDGRWDATDCTQILTRVKDGLTAVNTALNADSGTPGDCELVVASGRGSGENRPVRSLRIGRVPDTMRSRTGKMFEDYRVTPFQAV